MIFIFYLKQNLKIIRHNIYILKICSLYVLKNVQFLEFLRYKIFKHDTLNIEIKSKSQAHSLCTRHIQHSYRTCPSDTVLASAAAVLHPVRTSADVPFHPASYLTLE